MALALACVALAASASLGCGHSPSPTSTVSAITPRVQTYTADWDPAALTVSSLATGADVIVRGRVTQEPTARWNSADGKQWKPKSAAEGPQFYTTWIIRVDEVLKGSAKVGDLVDFRYVGGTVDFNGHRAHYVGNDYPDLSKDDQVIVFGITKTTMQNTAGLPGFWLLAPLGYLVAKTVSALLLSAATTLGSAAAAGHFLAHMLVGGAAGLVVLALINGALVKFYPKAGRPTGA